MKRLTILMLAIALTSGCRFAPDEEKKQCLTNDVVLSKEIYPARVYKGKPIPAKYYIHTCRNNEEYRMDTDSYTYEFYEVGDTLK